MSKKFTGIKMSIPQPRMDESWLNADELKEYKSADEAWKKEALIKMQAEFMKQVFEVMVGLEIEPGDPEFWQKIAWGLVKKSGAYEISVAKRGRRNLWNHWLEARLFYDVREKVMLGLTISEACHQMVEQEPWKAHNKGVSGLKNKYNVAAKSEYVLHLLALEQSDPILAVKVWEINNKYADKNS